VTATAVEPAVVTWAKVTVTVLPLGAFLVGDAGVAPWGRDPAWADA
jgi:hypothetical protein